MSRLLEESAADLSRNYNRNVFDPYGEDAAFEREMDVDSDPRPRCESCDRRFESKELQKDAETGCLFCKDCAAICPYCGEVGGSPVGVEDFDASVGYNVTEQMCTLCAPKTARRAA